MSLFFSVSFIILLSTFFIEMSNRLLKTSFCCLSHCRHNDKESFRPDVLCCHADRILYSFEKVNVCDRGGKCNHTHTLTGQGTGCQMLSDIYPSTLLSVCTVCVCVKTCWVGVAIDTAG